MMREVLEVEEVLLMQNLTVLCIVYGCSIVDAKSEVSESEMNQFWPYLPHLCLCLSSPLAKTSEDNYWWNFWINVRKMCNSDLYCEMKYLVWGGTRMKMVEIEDLGVRSRWDWDLMMNLFWLWFWWLSKVCCWWILIWWSRWCGREMRWGVC